jgi:hypothetical protein
MQLWNVYLNLRGENKYIWPVWRFNKWGLLPQTGLPLDSKLLLFYPGLTGLIRTKLPDHDKVVG